MPEMGDEYVYLANRNKSFGEYEISTGKIIVD